MAEIVDYERQGDLDAPFELTKKAERAQKQAEQVSAAVSSSTPPLTWEKYAVGEPCPGCGRPYRDGDPWESKGKMYFTDAERARYEAEQALYAHRHGECHAMRHSVSGSLTTHCGKCCPPPPMSPSQAATIAHLLSSPRPRPRPPAHERMRWRLRLSCGHVVERSAHAANTTVQAAFKTARACPQCGLDPATIVDGEAIGLESEPPQAPRASAAASTRSGKPTKAELEARVRELEAEVQQLRNG